MKNYYRGALPVAFRPLAVASAVTVLLGAGQQALARTTEYNLPCSVEFSPALLPPLDPTVAVRNLKGYEL